MFRLGFPWILAASIVRAAPLCPVISEIAASPRTGESEWIELADVAGVGRDLAGWTLDDGAEQKALGAPAMLAANGFLVVASDCGKLRAQFPNVAISCVQSSGWNRLSTDSDLVVLRAPEGDVCDAVSWSRKSWGDWPNGRTMERLSFERAAGEPSNWVASSAQGGGTPGWKELNALGPIGGEIGLETLARCAAPGRASVRIRLRAPWNAKVRAEVFDLSRRRVAILQDGQIPANGELEWDGRSGGRWVSPGAYALVIEFDRAGSKSIRREWLVVDK